MELLEPSHIACGNTTITLKKSWAVSYKVNIHLLWDPEILSLGILRKEMKTYVHLYELQKSQNRSDKEQISDCLEPETWGEATDCKRGRGTF